MKRPLLILAALILAGVVAFFGMRSKQVAKHRGIMLDTMPELAWVRSELKLSDEQFAKVAALHAAYRPKCVEMCRRISDAHEKLEELSKKDKFVSEEFKAAIREHATIHAECQETMLNHLYQTSRELNSEQAEKYLDAMMPYALDFTHSESGTIHAR